MPEVTATDEGDARLPEPTVTLPDESRTPDQGSDPTRWRQPESGSSLRRRPGFQTVLWVAVIGLISFSVLGTILAMCGWFHPVPVAVGTLAVTALATIWVLPAVHGNDPPVRVHWLLTIAVLGIAVVSGLWNGAHHGEHLVAERDPGVYIATGLWLGDHGNLRVGTPTGPFHEAPGVRQSGIGFSDNAVDSLDPQFAHLNAVSLAVGSWFGDTRLLLIPQLLMSGALVMLYALGARLGRPIGGAAAALALAVSYPFVYVARDTYSEPIALLLLLSGLWALTFVRRSGIRAGLIAGALLGATCLARIDGYIPLIPIAGIIALEWQLARRRGDARRAAGYVAAFGAMAVTASLGAFDVWAFSRAYYNSNLGPRIVLMVAGIIASTVIGSFAGRYLFRVGPAAETPRSIVRPMFAGVAVAVVAFLVWARFVRPDFAGLEQAMNGQGRVADLLPWAKTLSYLWLEWYLGPLLVAVSFAALIWMTGRGLFDENRVWLPTAAVGFATTLLYLYSPSITPDQPWAMRRFVAVSIPLLLLAAGIALETLGRRRPPWTTIGAGAVGLVLLIFPVRVTDRLADTAPGQSLALRFNQICSVAGEEPSAILVTPGQALGYTIPIALREWCDMPVAGATGSITPDEIRALALRWQADGRRLLILSTSPAGLVGVGGNETPIPGPALTGPEGSVTHAPDRIVPDRRISQSDEGVIPLFLVEVP